jgi:hypothetical protein
LLFPASTIRMPWARQSRAASSGWVFSKALGAGSVEKTGVLEALVGCTGDQTGDPHIHCTARLQGTQSLYRFRKGLPRETLGANSLNPGIAETYGLRASGFHKGDLRDQQEKTTDLGRIARRSTLLGLLRFWPVTMPAGSQACGGGRRATVARPCALGKPPVFRQRWSARHAP